MTNPPRAIPKSTPREQAIKAGANPDIIAKKTVALLRGIMNQDVDDLTQITADCSAISREIIHAVCTEVIQNFGLYDFDKAEILDVSQCHIQGEQKA